MVECFAFDHAAARTPEAFLNSSQGVKIWTEILIPQEREDILVIPGGRGAKKLLCLEEKSLKIMKEAAQEANICMMVGNGSSLLAQTGLLYRRIPAKDRGLSGR